MIKPDGAPPASPPRTAPFGRRHVLALLGAAALAACTGTMPASLPSGDLRPEAMTPEQMTAAVNAVRRANGRKPWRFNPQLATAARTHSNLMARLGQLSHELGGTLRERVTEAGYYGAVGENLAGGHATIAQAIAGWLDSPGHRSTLLSDRFEEFGLAVARAPNGGGGRYRIYWTLIAGGSFEAWRA